MDLYLRTDVRVMGWVAWHGERAVSAHADFGVLAALMAAEGLGDAVRYTRAEAGALERLTDSDGEAAELAPAGVGAPDTLR